MRAAVKWILVILWVLTLAAPSLLTDAAPLAKAAHPVLVPPPQEIGPDSAAMQGTSLALYNPPGCPPGGCVVGQRLNVRFNFKLESYDPALANGNQPNVKVCLYAPAAWGINPNAVDNSAAGAVTKKPYQRVADCTQDTDTSPSYTLIAALESAVDFREYADLLEFSFRLGKSADGSSQLVARVFQRTTDPAAWVRTNDSVTAPFSVIPTANTVYVANDPASCGGLSPCYVNSGDDKDSGIGTGLKDAVDAAPDLSPNLATIYVLGEYTIKSNLVAIQKPVKISGINNSTITYKGPGVCDKPMIALLNRVMIANVNINDGVCANPNRDLIYVSTPQSVQIWTSNLTGGGNAVVVSDAGGGAVNMVFNHITGNSGFALYWGSGGSSGALRMIANNLYGNRSGSQIECSASAPGVVPGRIVDHNYWGGPPPSQSETHCEINAGKALGAPIVRTNGVPGVNGRLVNVTTTETQAFGGLISYSRTGGSADFPIYIIDHGYAQQNAIPFSWKNMRSPSPCSNAWDVFLAPGIQTDATLNLGFKYSTGGTSCETVINSIQYCAQTNQAKYPLFWYDPQNGITNGWEMVGAGSTGQQTSCSIGDREILVAIDASGRPGITSDLNFTPFMVGVPVLKRFLPLASNQTITVTWETNNEPDLKGFYVYRSDDGVNFTTISELVAPKGNTLTGAYYSSVVDRDRVNNVTYYYQLEIIRNDGYRFYSEVFPIAANVATITPTPTISPTRTITRTWTLAPPTRTYTPVTPRVSTQNPTRAATRTNTPPLGGNTRTPPALPSGTLLPFRTGTLDPTDGFIPGRTQTTPGTVAPTPDGTQTPGDGTPVAMVDTVTVTPTISPSPEVTPSPAVSETAVSGEGEGTGPKLWLSLVIGAISGLVCVAAAGWLWYQSAQR